MSDPYLDETLTRFRSLNPKGIRSGPRNGGWVLPRHYRLPGCRDDWRSDHPPVLDAEDPDFYWPQNWPGTWLPFAAVVTCERTVG